MDAITYYQAGAEPVNSTAVPLRGKYLGRSLHSSVLRAFTGCDLHTGRKVLVEPTLSQCASIVGTDVTSIWWAKERRQYREEILRGRLPLVPPRVNKMVSVVPAPTTTAVVDADLVNIVKVVGVDRVLEIAAAVEAESYHH